MRSLYKALPFVYALALGTGSVAGQGIDLNGVSPGMRPVIESILREGTKSYGNFNVFKDTTYGGSGHVKKIVGREIIFDMREVRFADKVLVRRDRQTGYTWSSEYTTSKGDKARVNFRLLVRPGGRMILETDGIPFSRKPTDSMHLQYACDGCVVRESKPFSVEFTGSFTPKSPEEGHDWNDVPGVRREIDGFPENFDYSFYEINDDAGKEIDMENLPKGPWTSPLDSEYGRARAFATKRLIEKLEARLDREISQEYSFAMNQISARLTEQNLQKLYREVARETFGFDISKNPAVIYESPRFSTPADASGTHGRNFMPPKDSASGLPEGMGFMKRHEKNLPVRRRQR
jgi:hypothetical protein